MSDTIFSFIPKDPYHKLSSKTVAEIREQFGNGSKTKIGVLERVEFADAGENFETVSCPYCNSLSMGWWGEEMDNAYDIEEGFLSIDIITPCCEKETTLNDLIYYFDQGFYRTIVVIDDDNVNIEKVVNDLEEITKIKWKSIIARI